MNQMLPRPRFWAQAAAQMKLRFTLLGETLILMLLYMISNTVAGTVMCVPILAWLLSTQSTMILESLNAGVATQEILKRLLEQIPDWMSVVALFATAGAVGFTVIFYCRKFQKRSLASMGLQREGAFGEYLLGIVVGLFLFGCVVAVGAAAGGFRLGSWSLGTTRLLLTLAALIGCAAQGAALELMYRGYFAPTLGARYPAALALFSSTLCFAMLESGGALLSMNMLNTLLLSLLLGIWVIKRGRLWGACAIHAAWTFAGNFLLNFAPADQHGSLGLLSVDTDAYRTLITGGDYGPAASICATVVLLAAIGLVLALPSRDPAPAQADPAPEEQ